MATWSKNDLFKLAQSFRFYTARYLNLLNMDYDDTFKFFSIIISQIPKINNFKTFCGQLKKLPFETTFAFHNFCYSILQV